MKRALVLLVACACGRVDDTTVDAGDAQPDADACAFGWSQPMGPARHENVCTQVDIDGYVACTSCSEADGGACSACLDTPVGASTWGPEIHFAVGADVIALPNVWECIDILTGTTACGQALYERDMCVVGQCDRSPTPPGPCTVAYEASTCNQDALAGACKPYNDALPGACAGILDADGTPLPVVAECFAGEAAIAAVFCGPH